mmetsp:Transcript_65335/g.142366  ORF Transcript_65335/g.142366 Transcript_65335/m.142366 type:complete len:252 (-) Transcript_65335:186-941(-)
MARASSFRSCSSSSRTAAMSDPWTRSTNSLTALGSDFLASASCAAAAAEDSAGFAVPAADEELASAGGAAARASAFSGALLALAAGLRPAAASGEAAGGASRGGEADETERGKRRPRSNLPSSALLALSRESALGAPCAASARRSSPQPSGRGVKSTHLPSGKAFHQYLSATKAALTARSRCSKTAQPRITSMPVAFSTFSAFAKLWSGRSLTPFTCSVSSAVGSGTTPTFFPAQRPFLPPMRVLRALLEL